LHSSDQGFLASTTCKGEAEEDFVGDAWAGQLQVSSVATGVFHLVEVTAVLEGNCGEAERFAILSMWLARERYK